MDDRAGDHRGSVPSPFVCWSISMSFMSLSLPGDGMAPVSYMDNVTRLMPSLAAISSCEKPNFTLASLNVFAMSVSMADTIPPIVYGVKHLLHWVVSQFKRNISPGTIIIYNQMFTMFMVSFSPALPNNYNWKFCHYAAVRGSE
jgi:hypothetical protein